MRFGLFRSSREPTPDAIERVKRWASATPGIAAGSAFSVNEIVCTDPSCPGTETVILVMEPGRKTRACKLAKALAVVTEQEVRKALVP